MSEEQQGPRPSATDANAERIMQGLTEMVTTTLGVGAALAKAAAQATAGDDELAAPPERATPVDLIVHYGIATVTNVVGAVMSGVSAVGERASPPQEVPPAERAPSTAPAQPPRPTIRPGSTLRMPLSIENPGPDPMEAMAFQCLALSPEGLLGAGEPLTPAAVRFDPPVLSVAPRDFEKLTVYIEAPEETAVGRYTAVIGLPDGAFEMAIPFDVAVPVAG